MLLFGRASEDARDALATHKLTRLFEARAAWGRPLRTQCCTPPTYSSSTSLPSLESRPLNFNSFSDQAYAALTASYVCGATLSRSGNLPATTPPPSSQKKFDTSTILHAGPQIQRATFVASGKGNPRRRPPYETGEARARAAKSSTGRDGQEDIEGRIAGAGTRASTGTPG
jgi:hypothetical protein